MADRPDYLPWVVLAVIVLAVVVGVVAFPAVHRYVAHQDCIGQGATNCQ